MCSDNSPERNWYPDHIINDKSNFNNYAVIVLNREIIIPTNLVQNIWQNAKIRITVDGGTNRWLSFIKTHQLVNMRYPDLITGDFDSISEEAWKYFTDANCQTVHTQDQNETDFTKCLRVLKPIVDKEQITGLIVFHETSGRLDQIMANINTLYKSTNIYDNLPIYLLSGISLTWLLNPGKHSIVIPHNLCEEKRWCGLIPVGQETVVSTKGLKWNLDAKKIQFGEIVSTSNTYASPLVNISTSKHLLWTMGVFNFDN